MTADTHPTREQTSGWVVFCGVVISLAAASNLLYAITLLTKDHWVVLTPEAIVRFDATVAGITLLIFAGFQFLVALGVFRGALWARILGIIGASLNALAMMSIMSVYPAWAWLILAIDGLIIYGLTVHGDEVAEL